jgi:hypothetical protein
MTLVDRTIHVDHGAAIKLEQSCRLTLIRCDVRGPIAIDIEDAYEPRLTLRDSRIEGTELAFKPSFSSHVEATGSLVIGLVSMRSGQPAMLHGITAVLPADIPGAPHAIDPAALVDMARRLSGLGERSVLAQIDGVFVSSNGRVDFDAHAYQGRVHYRFELPPRALTEQERFGGAPLGVPVTSLRDPDRRQLRTVTADIDGIRLDEARSDGVVIRGKDVLPHCSFQQVWNAARTGDVPADAPAHIMYNSDSGGQAWWFHVDDTQFTFSISAATCKR